MLTVIIVLLITAVLVTIGDLTTGKPYMFPWLWRWNREIADNREMHQCVEEGRLVWCYCSSPESHLIKDIESDVVKPISEVIKDAERIAQNDYDRWARDQEHWTPWFEGDQLMIEPPEEPAEDKPTEQPTGGVIKKAEPYNKIETIEFSWMTLDGQHHVIKVPKSKYGPYGYNNWRKP